MIQFKAPRERDPDAPNLFAPGDLVRHKRYGYRGLVVAFDETCQASEAWYRSNRSQPGREQPWYHVLVHDAMHSTYAAESNLTAEWQPEEIRHPWLEHFFQAFLGDRYVRNERPWEFPRP